MDEEGHHAGSWILSQEQEDAMTSRRARDRDLGDRYWHLCTDEGTPQYACKDFKTRRDAIAHFKDGRKTTADLLRGRWLMGVLSRINGKVKFYRV